MVLTIFIKYILHTVDLQSENPWDNKAVYMLYTELFTGAEYNYTGIPFYIFKLVVGLFVFLFILIYFIL